MKLRKIGEVFKYGNVMLRVEEEVLSDDTCFGCYFDNQGICIYHNETITGPCYDSHKSLNVVFKKEGGEK